MDVLASNFAWEGHQVTVRRHEGGGCPAVEMRFSLARVRSFRKSDFFWKLSDRNRIRCVSESA